VVPALVGRTIADIDDQRDGGFDGPGRHAELRFSGSVNLAAPLNAIGHESRSSTYRFRSSA